MRRAPSLLALLIAMLACAALGVAITLELQRSLPAESPRAAIGSAAEARAAERERGFAAQDRAFDVPFDPAMVRDTVAWTALEKGAKTTDVALVNATPGADLERTARECVAATEAEHATAVQCYVFANTEAYAFKNISAQLDLDTPTAIVNLCWAVLARTTGAGATPTISDMRAAPAAWAAQGCPEGWAEAKEAA